MPCETSPGEVAAWSDHCLAVKLFNYVAEKIGSTDRRSTDNYKDGAPQPQNFTERVYIDLCGMMQSLTPERRDEIVYDARNPAARALADWWEYHERMDREREESARESAERNRLRKEAAAKLTPEERRALGLKD